MFLDDMPIYLPGESVAFEKKDAVKQTVILLPGEEKHYAPDDIALIGRLMSALGIEASCYEVTFISRSGRLSSANHLPGTLIINMGVDWDLVGIHVALAMYQVRQVGQYFLLSSDLPSKLGKDSGMKKLLWNELMKVYGTGS